MAAYVVAGLQPQRVQPVIEVALARFKQDQLHLAELAGARHAVQTERNGQRSIAQAKALLARRGMSETDA